MKTNEWLRRVTRTRENEELSINGIALKAGTPQPSLHRRVKADNLSLDQILAICVAYRYDLIKALEENGYIDREQALQLKASVALSNATDQQIVDEILRRLSARPAPDFEKPITLDATAYVDET